METGFLHLHNFLRWAILLCGIWAILSAWNGKNKGQTFSKSHKRPALLFLIFTDIQLVLGILLFTMRGWLDLLKSGNVMSNKMVRFFTIEHSLLMLIAVIMVHIGYSFTKRDIPDKARFGKMFTFFLIAILLMLVSIPWPFRPEIGRPWF